MPSKKKGINKKAGSLFSGRPKAKTEKQVQENDQDLEAPLKEVALPPQTEIKSEVESIPEKEPIQKILSPPPPQRSLPHVEEKSLISATEVPQLQDEEVELLAFYLGGEEYAVDIMVIQEITKFVEVTSIPRMPSYIKGIVTLRGNVIPVFDMHRRLNLPPFQKGSRSRFIIAALTEGVAAMMVDEITEVILLKRSQLELPPPGLVAHDLNFIDKIGRLGERLFILLNINDVLKVSIDGNV